MNEQKMIDLVNRIADNDKVAPFQNGFVVLSNEEMVRYTELIVGECVQTLVDNTPERYTNESAEEDWDKGYDRAMKDCVHHIQEHFGVGQ